MKSLFDQSLTAEVSGVTPETPPAPIAGIVAAADAPTIAAFAQQGVTVAVLIYTQVDPQVAVGDRLSVGSIGYPVVAATRPYVSSAMSAAVYVTPCGAATS